MVYIQIQLNNRLYLYVNKIGSRMRHRIICKTTGKVIAYARWIHELPPINHETQQYQLFNRKSNEWV